MRKENARLKENKKLQEDILKIYNESGKIYGAPKIREKLKEKGFYNRKRIHSSINYMTPNEYENVCKAS
jgi:repressor of nif and glnA expression